MHRARSSGVVRRLCGFRFALPPARLLRIHTERIRPAAEGAIREIALMTDPDMAEFAAKHGVYEPALGPCAGRPC